MKKKNVLALMMALAASATMITGCGTNYTVKLTDTNPVRVELGSELSTDVRDYITVFDGEEAVNEGDVFGEIQMDTSGIDVNTPGTYTLIITYEQNQLVIPVIVEDTTAPEITVEDLTLAAGTEVTVSEYVTVVDAEETEVMFVLPDGSRTDKFTFDGTPLDVTVEAEDAAGNKTIAVMKVSLLDTTAPVINAEDVTIYVNDEFDVMSGVTANDDVDGNITANVTVSGTVDTTEEGTYTLTYEVADTAGNEASVERTVTVAKKSSGKKSTGTGSTASGTTATTGNVTNNVGGNTTTASNNGNAGSAGSTGTGGNTGTTNSGGTGNSSTPPDNVGPIDVDPGLQDIIDGGGNAWDDVDIGNLKEDDVVWK